MRRFVIGNGFSDALKNAGEIWKFPGEAKDTADSFASPAMIAKEGIYKVTLEGTWLYDATQKQTLTFETEVNYGLAE